MTTVADIQAKVDKTIVNMNRLDLFINGPANATVQTDNGSLPTLAGLAQSILPIQDQLGESTTVAASQRAVTDAIAAVLSGVGFTLPSSAPSTSGSLFNDGQVVKVTP